VPGVIARDDFRRTSFFRARQFHLVANGNFEAARISRAMYPSAA
jgi:hypothetical protein